MDVVLGRVEERKPRWNLEVGDGGFGAAAHEDAADVEAVGAGGGRQRRLAAQRVRQVDADLGHVEQELDDLRVAVVGGQHQRLLRRFGQTQFACRNRKNNTTMLKKKKK